MLFGVAFDRKAVDMRKCYIDRLPYILEFYVKVKMLYRNRLRIRVKSYFGINNSC